MKFNEHTGVMDDEFVSMGLEWLCQVQDDSGAFLSRLEKAQCKYIASTNDPANFGKDFDIKLYGHDIVASFFAQAKSLLDNRRVYDISIASNIIPWVKQLGRNCHLIEAIPGAKERAKRMLEDETVYPDTALFELVVAGNYADRGFQVEFIPEQKGIAKTPDLKYRGQDGQDFYIECKRLQKGRYETIEKQHHREIINHEKTMRILEEFNLWMDITYKSEVKDIPHDYIYKHLKHYEGNFYTWNDIYGQGVVRPISLSALLTDILINGSIMFNTKFARLIKGDVLRDEYYNIYARVKPDDRDNRFVECVYQAALVTWRCVNEASFEGRSKHVTSLLKTIDDQLLNFGPGIAHIAIDVDVQGDVADKRRQKNIEAITRFRPDSRLCRTMVHYMVPRIDEDSAWMVDETSDELLSYPPELGITPRVAVFTDSETLDNDRPGWRQ
ncbi:hypothetical protein [Pectobacterium brasiliense]|uniref:hypothetical protein n=1 Tax=Pectobacterium brasiliense TaxID=180957 RepID=UPI001F09A4C1|nr:hypothetical protein [Pectobacterium brasiliense]